MTQLTMKDKIGYGLGDTACGFVWQATMFLLAYFYTDVFGLSAGIMGTLFLVSRVLDAVTDPLMGLLVTAPARGTASSARSCCGAPSRLASSAC
jgi:Na+/melibiose symporter-like transporter